MTEPAFVLPFHAIDLDQIAIVGGKNANLGVLLRFLTPIGIRVPDGFAITTTAFRQHLRAARLDPEIYARLDALDPDDVEALARTAATIREQIRAAPLPDDVVRAVVAAYTQLSRTSHEEATDVAVRSSATAEDLPEMSFAGQHDSFTNVQGNAPVLEAVRACMASLFTDRAIVYRREPGVSHRDVALSVGVQRMVRSDLACAGVMFTLDTETGFRDVVEIDASWGLGESVVKGRVNPDSLAIHKPTLQRGFRPIVRRDIGNKQVKLVHGAAGLEEVAVPERDRRRQVLTDDESLQLARWAIAIEDHYAKRSGRAVPMDIEWAKDGRSGELFVVQARPETVHARVARPTLELYRLTGHGDTLITGKSVGTRIGSGRARVIHDIHELATFVPGEVLVAEMTDPDWEPVLAKAAAIVTDRGGRTCHAAIVARELGVPCVVGTDTATQAIATGDLVTVSCAEGDVGHVYRGEIPHEREVIDPAALPSPPMPVMLNVGDPSNAFAHAQLPSAGVGLARIEFIVSTIGIHPMALVHPERVRDPHQHAELLERIRDIETPSELFVGGLATGVAQIAAAFYPRPVIVRFSDFKSNEYATLLGGKDFEIAGESNPMLGFRGASRYYDDRYREGFALECAAIQRVRRTMGLTNVKVMIPFCRTLEEARRVLDEMAAAGLRRGEAGLEVYVMCEIPNNVILAAQFAEYFDGFSIGSNDLTQLVLGVDRDSALLAHVFDEADPGVRTMIAQVVESAHLHAVPVGFCGQAPSDRPEYASFLAGIGIDSISVTPDALPAVLHHLNENRPAARGMIARAASAVRRRVRRIRASRATG